MKKIFILTIVAVIIATSSFAVAPITGPGNLCPGSSINLTDATTGGTWSSGTPTVATIGSSSGVVTGVLAGTSVITYTSGPSYVTQVVTVNAMPSVITGDNTLCVADSLILEDWTVGGTWSSADAAIATISSTGVVTGIAAGTVMMSYTIGDGCSVTDGITVLRLPSPIEVVGGAACLPLAGSYNLTDSTPGGVWTDTSSSVVVMIGVAFFVAISSGNTTITYTSPTGCMTTKTLTVYPTLTTTSGVSPSLDVCDSMLFHYMPDSVPGETVMWTRAYVPGIDALAATGTDSISETLVNATYAPIAVTYVYTLAIGACVDTQNLTLTVNPGPVLSSTVTPTAICDTVVFHYTPASATAGTTFEWSRGSVSGITNPPAAGMGDPAELLLNITSLPVPVVYVYTLTANGCTNVQDVTVVVDPCGSLTVPNLASAGSFVIYPNPATTELTISAPDNITSVSIANLLGQTLYSSQLAPGSFRTTLDVASLPGGVYFVRVNPSAGSGQGLVRKFVKE